MTEPTEAEKMTADFALLKRLARGERDGRMGRRRDPDTGPVIGMDETTSHVTTVYGDDELLALKL